MPADQSQTSVPGQGVQGETLLPNAVGHSGQEVWKCTKRCGGGHARPPLGSTAPRRHESIVGLVTNGKAVPTVFEEQGCEKSWLNAAEDEKRWRALVGGLHFKESTFDKKGDESRIKSHPVVSPWTCCECGEHFISEMARDQHARKKHGRRCTLS